MKASKSPANTRAQAALILSQLYAGSGSLTTQLQKTKDSTEHPLLQEICFGACRWCHQLDARLALLLEKPLKAKDNDIRCLLIIGLYQLHHMRIPDHAAINETVAATKALKKPWAKGLVNAVLRNSLRRGESLEEKLCKVTSASYSHPQWLIDMIAADWPGQWEDILQANNGRPPLTLRINNSKSSREDYARRLDSNQLAYRVGKHSPHSLYLEKGVAVETLPGFDQGQISVQDEASQLVPGLLRLEPGLRVLDACAAPGGKTCHLLECEPRLSEVVALEIDERRASRIQENLDRLGLDARILVADARERTTWWDGELFDRILLDVPCSATGVIRRHPDIKLLRTPEQIELLGPVQRGILESTWECLRPGGLLLYTSCSVLRRENSAVLAAFLNDRKNAKCEAFSADWGVECDYGRQMLPGSNGQDGFLSGPDGFFYCLLRKEERAKHN